MLQIQIGDGLNESLGREIERQVILELGSAFSAVARLELDLSRSAVSGIVDTPSAAELYVCRIEGATGAGTSFSYLTKSRDVLVAVSDAVARLRRDIVRQRLSVMAG